MSLGVGLYIIPLAMIANPAIIGLSDNVPAALFAFTQIGLGLGLISYGLIGMKKIVFKVLFIAAGSLVIFGQVLLGY